MNPQVETWDIARLVPYPRNPRKNDAAVDRMVASIKEFGFKIPVLARSSGEIVDGHLRLKAAVKMGISKAPVILCDEWTDAQVKAFRLMVNRSVMWAEWDEELLSVEFTELKDLGFDLSLTGFDGSEIDAIFTANKNQGLTDEDAVPDVQQVAVSKREDLWILGNHRLFCGDGTTASNVARLLDKVKPNLMVTDPPYGVDYDPNWRNEADRANGKPYGARAVGLVSNDHRADWSAAWKLFSGNIAYVWHGGLHTATVARSLQNCGFVLRAQIIWSKNNFAISRGDYHWKHEPCWYAVRGKGNWAGDRSQTTVWNIDKPLKSDTGHSTQKPVECMRRPMQNNSNGDQVVYEPFCGSGSTIIAAEQLGRRCYALEIEPLYCDVIIKRWQDFTGQKATLQGDKRTFSEIADARQKPKTSRRSA